MQRDVVKVVSYCKGICLLADLQKHENDGNDLNGDHAHKERLAFEKQAQNYGENQKNAQRGEQGFWSWNFRNCLSKLFNGISRIFGSVNALL